MYYTCSLIVRSFNEEKHIGRLLEGIKKQTLYSETEVILVDSGSTDNTVKIALEHGAKVISIKPEEFSFGRALNKGCEMAAGKYLLFASAHVYPVYTDWIKKMIQPFDNKNIALVYGKQIGNEITKYSESQIFKKWFPDDSNYNQDHPFCNNANAVVRKELWLNQQYDETLTGLEDLDWARKIEQKGHVIAYEADAPIVHVHEESISKIKNRYMREAIALKKIFPKQHMSLLDFARLYVANTFSDFVHARHDGVLFKNVSEIIRFRYMQFWGTYKGFKHGEVNTRLRQRFYYPNGLRKSSTEERENAEKIVYLKGNHAG
ncbi:glycosyltransferase family 2 protein [Mucilaginibacter sp.]|uniref:glycosyltransferase family 2 protein n=1 Tax=Mucilaginibacter sp. TaxID=1882438 RepID=UPI0032631AB4